MERSDGGLFDENHARSIGLNPGRLKLLFYAALRFNGSRPANRRCISGDLHGGYARATARLLTDRFPRLLTIAVAIGSLTSFSAPRLSYWLDGATGGIIVVLQTLLFLLAFVFAPKHGLLANRRRARLVNKESV